MSRFARLTRRPLAAVAALALLLSARAASAQAVYESGIESANSLHLGFTNSGVLGNNFVSRSPSLEYPFGTGYEHLTHAGLWVGAHANDGSGAFDGVATAGFDQSLGSSVFALSEFTPVTSIVYRSTNLASPYYSPLAVSDLDCLATFDDQTAKTVTSSLEPHRPMGLVVRQEIYAWNSSQLGSIVFVHSTVRAIQPLTGVRLGMFTELASGPKSSYVNWPPSTADPGGLGGWFAKKWVAYEDSLALLREHYCASQPIPSGCFESRTPYWAGMRLLTPLTGGQQRTVAAWSWMPSPSWHAYDAGKYAAMSAGTQTTFTGDSLLPSTGDPVEVVSIGPYASLAAGDSLEFDVAFMGAPDEPTLRDRARIAQQVHDAGYANALTPAQASLLAADATPDRVRLTWWTAGSDAPPARVERRAADGGWADVGAPAADGSERWRFDDFAITPGARYAYRLRFASGETAGEASVLVPARLAFGLRLASGNPSAPGALALAAALAADAPARLDVFDASGRRLASRELAAGAAGERTIRLDPSARLAPGVYLARLVQGAHAASLRFVVLE